MEYAVGRLYVSEKFDKNSKTVVSINKLKYLLRFISITDCLRLRI